MRLPWTAKDDQPGPIGRRQSWTGGDTVQSVLIRTPGMTLSRCGPRKPGHSLGISTLAGAFGRTAAGGAGATGSLTDGATGNFSGTAAATGTSGRAAGSMLDRTRRSSSGVFVHRQCKSFLKLAVKPPVRMSAIPPHTARMAATIVARRVPLARRRVATAHAAKARPRSGIARAYNKNPIAPPAIDSWTMRLTANIPMIIRAMAPKRSDHAARLKNSHHKATRIPPANPPSTPYTTKSGPPEETTILASPVSIARTTPGHSRSGFRGDGSTVCAMVISDQYSHTRDFVPSLFVN